MILDVELRAMDLICPHCKERFRVPPDQLQDDMQKMGQYAANLVLAEVARTRRRKARGNYWLAGIFGFNVLNACYGMATWGLGWNAAPATPLLVVLLWFSIAMLSLIVAQSWWPR